MRQKVRDRGQCVGDGHLGEKAHHVETDHGVAALDGRLFDLVCEVCGVSDEGTGFASKRGEDLGQTGLFWASRCLVLIVLHVYV